MTTSRPYARLASLLGSMFTNDELRQFLLTHTAPDIHEDLPPPQLAKGDYMARVADLLLGRELLTPRLLSAWLARDPERQADIRDLRRSLASRPHVADSVAEHLVRVPELPLHYVERGELASMESALSTGTRRWVGLYSEAVGVGKTMLAAACARSPVVRRHFADGVYWLTLGPRPKLLKLLRLLAHELGVSDIGFDTPGQGQRRLRTFLQDKRVLLVLDDVWNADHAAALDVCGMRGRILVTTQIRDVLLPDRTIPKYVGVMGPDEAVRLLAGWQGAAPDSEAKKVALASGYRPLALTMAGGLVEQGQLSWAEARERIEQARPPAAADARDVLAPAGADTWLEHTKTAAEQTFRVMAASMSDLAERLGRDPAELAQRYADLAVFDQREPIPRSALRVMWTRHGQDTMDEAAVDELGQALAARELAEVREDDVLGWWLRLHPVQYAYARALAGDVAALHGQFVDAYTARCEHGLARGPVDGYFFRQLPFHLFHAGRGPALRELLLDIDWLDAKLRVKSAGDLVADFELMRDQDPELALIGEAMRLSRHTMARDPDQLAGHIVGRLAGFEATHPGVARLLEQARGQTRRPWLRPLVPGLRPPGGPLLRTLVGHEDSVNTVVIAADSKRAVSTSYDNTLRVWDLDTATELRKLTGHTDWVWAVAVTPDGGRALSASMDLTMKLWDLHTGAELRTFEGHDDSVLALAITPDGTRALSASDDQTLAVWDLDTCTRLHTLTGHADRVWSLAILPDGERAVSASSDGTLKLWDLERGAEVRTFTGHSGWVVAVAVTPDGKRVVSASSDQTIRLWDVDTGEELRTVATHDSPVVAMALTPDGKRVLSSAREPAVTVWDLDSGARLGTMTGHSSTVLAVAVTPDGRHALSASHDQTMVLWDLDPGVSAQIPSAAPVLSVGLRPADSGWQVMAVSQDKSIRCWEGRRSTELEPLASAADAVSAMAVTPDGSRALLTAYGPTIEVWDIPGRSLLGTLPSRADSVVALAVTPDATRALSGSLDGLVELWDVPGGAVQRAFPAHGGSVLAAAITPDGSRALTASVDRTLKLWDLDAGQEVRTLVSHSDSIVAVDMTADSRRAVTAAVDRTVAVWDLTTGEIITVFVGDAPMRACALSPDGDVIAAGDQRGSVHVFELITPGQA